MNTSVCFLLHFERPIGNPDDPLGQAQHYLGSSAGLEAELARFRANGGHAKIMKALHREGVGFVLARTWPGGRVTEGRLKGRTEQRRRGQGLRRLCPECGHAPLWMMRGDDMIGGYSLVAGMLNRVYRPEPPIDRRQIAAWHARGTRNQAGDKPPEPAERRADPPRTTPRLLFDTDAWVKWFAAGVPGPRGKGWRVWQPVDPDTAPPWTPPGRMGRRTAAAIISASLSPAGNNPQAVAVDRSSST